MSLIAATGAVMTCAFGTAPSNLTVTSQTKCMVEGKPAGTIQDASMVNIAPFAMCTSLANPQVAAATAAALGVLTPQPCMPQVTSWIPAHPKILIGGKPCLTADCTCICTNGMGSISINFPGETKADAN